MPLELVDIGANLAHPSFSKDLGDVIDRAKQAGLSRLMITGTCINTSREAAKLAEREPGFLFFTAGVHPHEAKTWDDNTEAELRALLAHPQCVAVGETGLDCNRNFSPPDVQREALKKQVELACELKRPLFLHEREGSEGMQRRLKECGDSLPLSVIHCFTGTQEEAEDYLALHPNIYIGLTGFLLKDKSENGVQAGLRSGKIPIERLVLETDAPYMYPKIGEKKLPEEVKKCFSEDARRLHKFASFTRNEPCSLLAICEMIAVFAGRKPEEVAAITTANAKKIYNL